MKRWLLCALALMLCFSTALGEEQAQEIDWSRPIVALTFDDGPGEYTEEILRLLEENGCHATFFMLGKRMSAYADAVQAVAESDNEIGTHTWAHDVLKWMTLEDARKSLYTSVNKIEAMTGREVRFFRPPHGFTGENAFTLCREMGLVLVTWSLDSEDWQAASADEVYNTIISQVKNGDIILCHDTKENTLLAMERVLPELVSRGYQVVSVGELFSNYSEELRYNYKYKCLDLEKVGK